jgi:uncharacterized protein (TIGR03000 family)
VTVEKRRPIVPHVTITSRRELDKATPLARIIGQTCLDHRAPVKEPPMRRAHLLVAFVCFWFSAPPLYAQYFGPYRPFGVYPYGYLGYYPGAYQNSWSNGFSLYGPPVPTYGSVPGAFGASDYRLNNNIQIYNGANIGLGGPGAGGGGPRRRFYTGGDGGFPSQGTAQALLEVRVPVDSAIVLFEDTLMKQQGKVRQFASPPLQVGLTYFYKIRARWQIEGGTMQEQTRSVGVRANEKIVVDFTQPDPANNPPIAGKE